jgi:hypothetical protein
MRHFGGFGLALLTATGLFAQTSHGGVVNGGVVSRSPVVSSGFGHVLSPSRRSLPGLQGTGPGRPATGAVYAYPVYVGGYGYVGGSGYAPAGSDAYYGQDAYGQDFSAQQQPQQQQAQPSNVTVVSPPQQTTIIINQYPASDGGPATFTVQQGGPPLPYGPPPPPPQRRPVADDTAAAPSDGPHYLIAFKDHTIYSAMAYWVDGDTLHYFTTGNTHNQASLALVDRDLTDRLNQESGVDLKLPPSAAPAK